MFQDKFRALVLEPKTVPFSNIKIDQVLEYYHARNDVVHCLGTDGLHYVIKFARLADANFRNEVHTLQKINQIPWLKTPEVIETGQFQGVEYIVYAYVPGWRISQNLEVYRRYQSWFCTEFGKNLGLIHTIKGNFKKVEFRKFFNIPENKPGDVKLNQINQWLLNHLPEDIASCFVHGDHHYANILWSLAGIEATLDWELSGIGNKEFDLAWAVVVRPGQQFFLAEREEMDILQGYKMVNSFDFAKYQVYKILVIAHFYPYRQETEAYQSWMQREIKKITGMDITDSNLTG